MVKRGVAAAWAVLTASTAIIAQCGGNAADNADAGPSACDRANVYIRNCGRTDYTRTCPPNHSPDLDCEAACDLEVSCDYFLGRSPTESRQRAQCSSRCTCESATRRSIECGIQPRFDCDEICNCGYYYACDEGIPAYAECRAACPPWPEPTDAGDVVDASNR